MYNPYPPNYNSYYSNNTYNPYPPNYNSYYQNNNTYNPYDHQQRNPTGIHTTQCKTWQNKNFRWVRANHKDFGEILLQPVFTSCDPNPNLSSISANFIRPGNCEIEFSEDFSPLDLSAPVDYNGSIPPKYCRW